MYAVGFIFVVLGRSELFTEQTTLTVLQVLDRKAAPAALARLWAVVLRRPHQYSYAIKGKLPGT
jgi:formate/nitrite transporter FocA (FNT family)